MGMNRSIWVFNLLCRDGQMVHPWCEAAHKPFHKAQVGIFCSRRTGSFRDGECRGALRTLVSRHPVEKPWVGLVFDVDLDIYE